MTSKIDYYVSNSPPQVTILSQLKPGKVPLFQFLMIILIICFHAHVSNLGGFFSSICRNKILYTFPVFPICATCPAHYMLFDLATLIEFGDVRDIQLLIVQFLYSFVISPFLDPNILLCTIFHNSFGLSLMSQTEFYTLIQQQVI